VNIGDISAVSPRRISKILRHSRTARLAEVHEKDDDGNVCRKVLDIADVESRTDKPKEVIDLNEEDAARLIQALNVYKYTSIYIGVMVTIIAIILFLQLVF
jgi:hypothetical protein